MTKITTILAVVGILAMAGCAKDREPNTVRSGPQIESPSANSPGGKATASTKSVDTVMIDDSQASTDGSIVLTTFN